MRYHETLVARLVSKLVLDILPAAAASLIGGLVFTHYGLGRVTEQAAQVAPASEEMMQLLRDEHGLIVTFLKERLERERTELAADDAAHHGSADAAAAPNPQTLVPAKPISRVKMAVAAPASAPLIIAQAQQAESTGTASEVPQLLIAKTIGLKDHVVSVTHHVVSAIGGIPSWIGLIGDRLGGIESRSPPTDMVTAS